MFVFSSFLISSFSFLFVIAYHYILSISLYLHQQFTFSYTIQLDVKIDEESSEIKFKLQDTHDEYGPMAKDLRVRYNSINWRFSMLQSMISASIDFLFSFFQPSLPFLIFLHVCPSPLISFFLRLCLFSFTYLLYFHCSLYLSGRLQSVSWWKD